jgi:phosphatidate cytidylyltransferase
MNSNLKKRSITSLILLLLFFLIFNYEAILIYSLIVLGVLSIIEFSQLTKKFLIKRLSIFLLNIFFIFYIFIFCSLFYLISNLEGSKIILFILLSACIASDMGGYIFGKIFKGPKLTKISPNKTYSGSIGSITLSILAALFFSYYFFQSINFNIIITLCVTSIFCQLGDLIFSFMKRKAKIQDTGKILPGHGGILDRIDGVLIGLPFGLLTLIILN